MSGTTTQILVALVASIASLSGGFHIGWTSPSLIKLQAEDSDLPVTSSQGSWIASVFNIGGGIGAMIAGLMVIKWGRKLPLLITAINFIIACTLIAVAQNYWWLIVARIFAAFGYGGSTTILIIYLGEIADDRFRGGMVIISNQMVNVGVLLAYSVGPWVSRVALACVGLALPAIFAVCFVWMPESPYFLVMKNRTEAAKKSLSWLRGTSDVEEELKKIEESLEMEETGTLKELVMIPSNRKALMLVTLVIMAPKFSGHAAILSYSSLIFDASGSGLSTSVSVIIIGIAQLLGGVLSVFTVDSIGRRPLFMVSICGTAVSLAGEAVYFNLQAIGADVSSISWLPVTAIVGDIIFYAIGLGCLPYVIASEILPSNLKAVGTMCTLMIGSIISSSVTKLYQVIADAYGTHVPFWMFAACIFVIGIFVAFCLPETKQKSFRDIQIQLRVTTDSKMAIIQS